MRRPFFLALALAAVLAPAAASAEGVASCSEFKTGWRGAAVKLGLARSDLGFGAPDANGAEAVTKLAGIEGRVTCREGVLGRIELRSADDPAALETAVTSVLMGLDGAMDPGEARRAAATLRAEGGTGARGASSSWGPYELSWGPSAEVGRDEFVLDLAEN